MNARSLLHHHDDVAAFLRVNRLHILAISESWLDESVINGEIHFPGYNLFRYDRNHLGSGVAILCVDHLPCSLLRSGTATSGAEFLWVSVKSDRFNPLVFSYFYRTSAAPSPSVTEICNNIETMMLNQVHVIVCGVFNIDLSDPCKANTKVFQDFLTLHSLVQPISKPTRYSSSSASIVDLFRVTPDIPILVFLILPFLTTFPSSYVLTPPSPIPPPLLLHVVCQSTSTHPSLNKTFLRLPGESLIRMTKLRLLIFCLLTF